MNRATLALLIVVWATSAAPIPDSKAVLKGKVVRNTPDGTPVPLVSLTATGANQTVSNTDGSFLFEFGKSTPVGATVKVDAPDLKANGMAVVNWFLTNAVTLPGNPDTRPLTIIVTSEAQREEMTRRFLHLTSLRKVEEAYKKRIETSQQDRARLEAELDDVRATAFRLSDALARVSAGPASAVYEDALRLLAEGDVKNALALYEKALRKVSQENKEGRAALMAEVAQTLLAGPVTGAMANLITAAAVNSWRTAPSVDAWNAMQRSPLVQLAGVFPRDPFGGRQVSFGAARPGRAVTLSSPPVVWDDRGEKQKLTMRVAGSAVVQAVSPTGDVLATANDKNLVETWTLDDGHRIQQFPHPRAVRNMKFSLDGKWLATFSDDRIIRLWNSTTGEETKQRDFPGDVQDWSVCGDGDLLALAAGDGHVTVLSLAAGQERSRFRAQAPLDGLAFVPGCRQLAVLERTGTVHIVSSQHGSEIAKLPFPEGKTPRRVVLSPDGGFLAIVPAVRRYDPYEVWLVSLVDDRRVLLQSGIGFNYVDFTADGRGVVVSSVEPNEGANADPIETVQLWEFEPDGRDQTFYSDDRISAAAFSLASGGSLAVASPGGTILETRPAASPREIAGLEGTVVDLAYRRSAQEIIAVTAAGSLHRLLAGAAAQRNPTSLDNCCKTAGLSPGGDWLVYIDPEAGSANIVETATGRLTQRFTWRTFSAEYNEPTSVAISSDGKLVAVGQPEDDILIFRLPDAPPQGNDLIPNLPILAEAARLPFFAPSALRFDQKAALLGIANDDVIRVVEIEGAREVARINQGTTPTSLLSVDRQITIAADAFGRVHLWDLRPENMINRICSGRGANVTREQWKSSRLGVVDWAPTCQNWPMPSR